MLNDLLLLSGNDIPLNEVGLILHPPKIKEIAFIGEESFFSGCELLRLTKNKLKTEDRNHLETLTNFEIIMSMIKDTHPVMQQQKVNVEMVLSLLFPIYKIQIEEKRISFEYEDSKFFLDKENYDIFVNVLNDILCLGGSESDYNPTGNLAKQIADKFRDRQAKLAEARGENNQKVAILSRYVSILAVGENKDMNQLLNYTIYQLFDEFKRYQLKRNWDIVFQARMAGAKDVKDAEEWTDDIHSEVDRK